MPWVHHVNVKSKEGSVYCCLRNKVVNFDSRQLSEYCLSCKMFGGTVLGQGVECFWDDAREVNNPYTVLHPEQEFRELQLRTTAESS